MEDAASGDAACNSTRSNEVGRFGAVGLDWVVEREGVIISHGETKSPRQLNGLRPEHLEKTVFMDSTSELGLGRGGPVRLSRLYPTPAGWRALLLHATPA